MRRPSVPAGVRRPHIDERYVFTRLGGIAWAGLATTIYVSIGVIVDRSAGLAPAALLLVALFVALTAQSYTELTGLRTTTGERLVGEPSASTFGRLGFNELVSFVAGWAVLLDLLLLTAIGAEAFAGYALSVVPEFLGDDTLAVVVAIGAIVGVAVRNARNPELARGIWVRLLLALDAAVLGLLGVALVVDALQNGLPFVEVTPGVEWTDVVYAATIGVVAVTGFETAATLTGETRLPMARRTRFLVGLSLGTVVVLVLAGALASAHRVELLDPDHLDAPIAWLATALEPPLADLVRAAIGVLGAITLAVATNGAMLAVARLSSSLATSRQIPARIGRLSPRYGTPTTVITLTVLVTGMLVATLDLQTLIGLYAFGALLALTIVHGALLRLRFTLADAERRYRVPLSIRVGSGSVPVPTVLAFVLAAGGWVAVLALHVRAGWVGAAWMLVGLALYVTTRTRAHLPLRRTVVVPRTILSRDTAHGEFGSILVPIFGRKLDDDIVQSAGRLARDRALDVEESGGAQIEAIWVFEIPMSLPLNGAIDDERLAGARKALARAKAVGEEYEGVAVATATIRARRAGQGIVDEARRRGVDVIVMAAEDPSKVRGGPALGGVGDPAGRALGPVTSYVITHAPCRVLLTAPPLGDVSISERADAPAG